MPAPLTHQAHIWPLLRRSTLVAQLSGKQHPTPHRQHKAAPAGEQEPQFGRRPDGGRADQGLRAERTPLCFKVKGRGLMRIRTGPALGRWPWPGVASFPPPGALSARGRARQGRPAGAAARPGSSWPRSAAGTGRAVPATWRAVSGPALCAPWRESRRPRPSGASRPARLRPRWSWQRPAAASATRPASPARCWSRSAGRARYAALAW
jgi:hypothetical protein